MPRRPGRSFAKSIGSTDGEQESDIDPLHRMHGLEILNDIPMGA
jgi:hypothetical protein